MLNLIFFVSLGFHLSCSQ